MTGLGIDLSALTPIAASHPCGVGVPPGHGYVPAPPEWFRATRAHDTWYVAMYRAEIDAEAEARVRAERERIHELTRPFRERMEVVW